MTQQQQPLTLCSASVQDSGVVPGTASQASICGKDFRERTLRSLKLSLGKLWRRRSVTITEYDPTYKVAYLGNVLTGWAKGDGCVEKPLSTLWKNYIGSSKPDVQMKVTITQAGLKAVTKEHGLTEYWSHRITYCAAPASFPRIFCWVYRHEGRKLKQELRCHAVLCSKEAVARRMASQLKAKLAQSLSEFKRDKVSRQNARLSLANSVYDNPSLPRRKILLSTGSHNYRPPLERSKSAPKLMVIEESLEEGEEECLDYPKEHAFQLYKETMALNRLEEVVGEENCQEYSRRADHFIEMKDSSPRSLRNGDIVHRDKFTTSLSEQNHVSRLVNDDIGGDEMNTSTFRYEKMKEEKDSYIHTAGSRGMLRLKGSGDECKRRVGWKLDVKSDDSVKNRNTCGGFQTERLLVIGSCKDDVRRRIPTTEQVLENEKVASSHRESESDEGSHSLQSISSSGSSSSGASRNLLPEGVLPCLKAVKPLAPYVFEDADIQTPEDEVEVDLHPTGGLLKRRHPVAVDMDRLSAQLRRSATFPPPSMAACTNGGEISELDSLSEEDDAMETMGERSEGVQEVEEEDNVSDESGYAELMDVGVKETAADGVPADRKEKDVPHHQLMKTILRTNSRSSQCLQV